MKKTLHILNGDATFFIFKDTGIEGEILVWREILSEGPVSKIDLWNTRAKWITENFEESGNNYQRRIVDEVERLKNLGGDDTIYLWVEYDLVCQVNLIYILTVLNGNFDDNQKIFLICPDKIEGMPNFKGLGELNPTQLVKLLPTKIQLQKADLVFAAAAWDAYLENDPAAIEKILKKDFGNLPLLEPALKAHLLRFPKPDGLNYMEEILLELINNGIKTKPEIYAAFSAKESIFGMGDLQIDLVLKKLRAQHLIEGFDQ